MQKVDKNLNNGSSSNNFDKSYKKQEATKSYDFDGLVIEVFDKNQGKMIENCNKNAVSSNNSKCKDKQEAKPLPKQARPRSRSLTRSDKKLLQPHTKHFICGLCLNFIETDKEVILEKCRDIFCRLCLIQELIQCDGDVMRCPSKFTDCDKKILQDEVKSILGDKNYEIFMVHKLQMRFKRLVEKDKKEYEKM